MPETKNSAHLPPPLPPCRLYALLAREAAVGVIFRRGPSNWVQIIHWDTDKDIFTPGQWFHGRIYEKRCDLSPDGKLLIYFAMNLRTRNLYTDYTYAWTALSKPPYLTALALWPKGSCWAGGGLFPSETEVWLNHSEGEEECHPIIDRRALWSLTMEAAWAKTIQYSSAGYRGTAGGTPRSGR